jgi:aspartate kinase
MIVRDPEVVGAPVCGAALLKNESRVTVLGVPDRPGAALSVFTKVADKNIAMDMIVQNEGAEGRADISFTVVRDDLPATLRAVDAAVKELGAEGYTCDENVSKISVVGLGMATQPGVAGTMFRALAAKGINIQMITTSEIKISVLVSRESALDALRAVHEVFQLHVPPSNGKAKAGAGSPETADADKLVSLLQRMEKLVIEDVDLDESQSRVTFVGLPDVPGLAAQTFDNLAKAGVVVDMIVQCNGRGNLANISVTVPQKDLEKTLQVAESQAKTLKSALPTHCPQVAKLSVFGVGMRSHAGVPARMFQSLAKEEINVELISTSEVRVNVVVDRHDGGKAKDAMLREFADAMV